MTASSTKAAVQPNEPCAYLHAGHTVPVHLTTTQKTYCRRAVGAARFTYTSSAPRSNFTGRSTRRARPSQRPKPENQHNTLLEEEKEKARCSQHRATPKRNTPTTYSNAFNWLMW